MNTKPITNPNKTVGVILAGGRATRMDHQDKGLVNYNGQPLIYYAISALSPIVAQVIINANRNIERYQHFGLSVITDQTDSFNGPLAGVLATMAYTDADLLLVMPCDCPLIKTRHVQKLLAAQIENNADITVAFDGVQLHGVFFAVRRTLQQSLHDYLASGQRKVSTWQRQHRIIPVDFSNEPDILTNINTMNELSILEAQHQAALGHK
ncbi:Molybdenum cofactor guanylyltransferase [Crenothrix polyspora]|uniref:Molybdenum cofactor guanylyltransferase n=1 Tax=Crenothrix polyspora TaxID=360316 RepID=A0A1R4HIV7_9GAMM|nr:molybdenum cofactor guanylyltransferase MobA [Crenothrix polyspora]SJM96188.1 Molybdenum cofactor guanylyltransferase [Crenothrix polyspora]